MLLRNYQSLKPQKSKLTRFAHFATTTHFMHSFFTSSLRVLALLVLFWVLGQRETHAQVYQMGSGAATNGSNITVSCGTNTEISDSNAGSFGRYGDSENISVTFCSDSGDPLYFDFSNNGGDLDMSGASAGDSLSFYDANTGEWLAVLTSDSEYAFDDPSFGTLSTCVTLVWTSDNNSTNDRGFIADISCVAPPPSCSSGNPPAANLFTQAPLICNLDGYCGTTSSYYGELPPFNFGGTGGGCPTPNDGLFGGTLQNNSWIKFQAGATTVDFTFTIAAGGTCNGVQAGVFAFDATTSTFSRVSPCAPTSGSGLAPGTSTLTASGLTVGETYYIMMDGNAGSVCDYTINTTPGAVLVVSAGADQTICSGSSATLTATGPGTSTYTWTTLGGAAVGTGTSVSVSPTSTTSYVVEATGTCDNARDTVTVNVVEITAITAGAQSTCDPGTNTYTQEVTVTFAGTPTGDLVVNGQSFALGTSPQTVTLTGLTADGNAVNVTASFSSPTGCDFTENALFTAPAACNASSCSIDNLTAGAQSACDPGTNTYTQEITVTFTNPPGSGNLIVNGQSFAIGASPQTVTLTGLTADGNNVDVTASFSADGACTSTSTALFTAPASCTTGCAADNGTWDN